MLQLDQGEMRPPSLEAHQVSLAHKEALESLVAQLVKNLPAMQEAWVQSLGWEDPLEKENAIHSSILASRTPWTTVHGVAKSRTRMSDFHFHFTFLEEVTVTAIKHLCLPPHLTLLLRRKSVKRTKRSQKHSCKRVCHLFRRPGDRKALVVGLTGYSCIQYNRSCIEKGNPRLESAQTLLLPPPSQGLDLHGTLASLETNSSPALGPASLQGPRSPALSPLLPAPGLPSPRGSCQHCMGPRRLGTLSQLQPRPHCHHPAGCALDSPLPLPAEMLGRGRTLSSGLLCKELQPVD